MSDEEFPKQFSHSVKLEETAKGIRISVHGYGVNGLDTIEETVAMYKAVRDKLEKEKIPRAPMTVD